MINERLIEAEVDRNELARNLKMRKIIAKHQGLRPGEPANLTKTPSDPISHEKLETLHLILRALQKKGL